MNAAATFTRIPLNYGTIAAIIRKDLRALWPFALVLAPFVLAMTALFRAQSDYPEVVIHVGASQLHLAAVLFLLNAFGLPIGVATFIVLLVHQDPATDARNDWMVRPISALDLVAAKALVILAVALIPAAVGYSIYVATHDNVSIDAAMGSIVSSVIVCIFILVVAWLASSPVQALLAPLALGVGALLLALSLGLAIRAGIMDTDARRERTVEIPSAAATQQLHIVAVKREVLEVLSADGTKFVHRFFNPGDIYVPRVGSGWSISSVDGSAFEWRVGDRSLGRLAESGPINALSVDNTARAAGVEPGLALPRAATVPPPPLAPSAPVSPERVIDLTWPIVITELLLMLGAAGVVLWLLLVRRKLLAARMTFLGFFGAAILLLLLQGAVSTPRDEMIAFQRVSAPRPSPPEAERFAAFAKYDANGDQRLDRQEYAAVLEELGFSEQLDSLWMQRDDNMDGFVTPDEYRAAIPAAPGGPPAPDVQRFAAFTKHDANADRKLDRAEYRAVLSDLGFSAQFDTLWMQRDGNGDGFISAEEYGMPSQ
jgi:Ca2+-binding EF-hand superfamily protein